MSDDTPKKRPGRSRSRTTLHRFDVLRDGVLAPVDFVFPSPITRALARRYILQHGFDLPCWIRNNKKISR